VAERIFPDGPEPSVDEGVIEESVDGAVFVDPTGRRGRWWVMAGVVFSVAMIVYLGILLLALLMDVGPQPLGRLLGAL
jgi:hypothetical protein